MKLLLVEDTEKIATLISKQLTQQNFVVDHAPNLSMAREALQLSSYDVVILDRMLPDGDGVDLIKFSKKKTLNNRFLILSALGEVIEKTKGLDLGADDYLAKPFEPTELIARIRALLRRPLPVVEQVWKCGNLIFDVDSHNATIKDELLVLNRRELSVLEVLIRNVGRVVTRSQMENAIFGYDDEIQSNTLEAHVSRLRKRLIEADAGVKIHTVRGVGYMLKEHLCD